MEHLIIIGAGGYAKSVLDSIDYYNYRVDGFLDEFSNSKDHLGYEIKWKSLNEIECPQKYFYFIAIGNNQRRKLWYDKLKSKNLRLINVVDRSAIISPEAKIGNGCFFGKMSVVNSKAVIGDNCIVNTKSLVEHGCKVSDHANISTNAVINGDVIIGEGTFVGTSSTTIGQKKIGSWSTIGAGAVVIKDVNDGVTVAGVPAKVIKEGAMLG
ncbi:acetyltransferase [Pseudobutyrivibrio sp.]|uniref:acetyltransferase n=1 Tax=Pseudobutyrivibrio sp. TaxID=2014367 RepID=UPI001D4AB8F8|nr:acetyltransferase [Pseudobutyrivibrio sp.]MBE5910043.1 acetyltransferase [Pseudobutyrivibrio sp.]